MVCYTRCLYCGRRTPHEVCHRHSTILGGRTPNVAGYGLARAWKRGFPKEPEECDGCLQTIVDWSSNWLESLQQAGVTDPDILRRAT